MKILKYTSIMCLILASAHQSSVAMSLREQAKMQKEEVEKLSKMTLRQRGQYLKEKALELQKSSTGSGASSPVALRNNPNPFPGEASIDPTQLAALYNNPPNAVGDLANKQQEIMKNAEDACRGKNADQIIALMEALPESAANILPMRLAYAYLAFTAQGGNSSTVKTKIQALVGAHKHQVIDLAAFMEQPSSETLKGTLPTFTIDTQSANFNAEQALTLMTLVPAYA